MWLYVAKYEATLLKIEISFQNSICILACVNNVFARVNKEQCVP